MDLLTGKAKELFEKWLKEKYKDVRISVNSKTVGGCYFVVDSSSFYLYPKEMQQGVYLDWMDSEGYEVYCHCDNSILIFQEDLSPDGNNLFVNFDSRASALEYALKKCNELINNKP